MIRAQNRQERLAALNGESRVFVCADCGKVRHVKDAEARVRRTANLVCRNCVVQDILAYKLRKAAFAFLSDLPVWPRRVDITVTMPGVVKQVTIPFKMEVTQ